MSTPILSTKLYIPSPRLRVVLRPRLIERLNEGLRLQRKLILHRGGFSLWNEGKPVANIRIISGRNL